MIIDEAGLVRQMKAAQKKGGYTVFNEGTAMTIYTKWWLAEIREADLMRKVLATVVEHCGYLPKEADGLLITKDADPQTVLPEEIAAAINEFIGGTEPEEGERVTYTMITAHRYEVFQESSGQCWAVPVASTDLVDPSNKLAKNYGRHCFGNYGNKIVCEDVGGKVVMKAIRPAAAIDSNELLPRIFTALESVRLDQEQDA